MDFREAADTIRSVLDIAAGPKRRHPAPDDLPVAGVGETKATNRMEKFWIGVLHESFARALPEATVLSSAMRCPDHDWVLSEFLHDLTVVIRRNVPSPYKGRLLAVGERFLWQVESELSGDTHDVAIDLSKLVAGSADSKLLVVRLPMEWQTDGLERVCAFVDEAGRSSSGNLFVVFVPCYASGHKHLNMYWKSADPLPIKVFGREYGSNLLPVAWP